MICRGFYLTKKVMNSFEKYKRLKSIFDFTYKGIHLNRVLAMQLWMLANGQFKLSWKAHALALLAVDVSKIVLPSAKQTILSTFGRYPNRKDHLEIYQTVLKKLGNQASYNNMSRWPYKLAIHPRMILKICVYIKKSLSNSSLSLKDKLGLAVLCVHYCNTLEELQKLDLSNVKKYLCQCSVLDLENLFTQFMKQRGIPTYSLQEGIYFIFKINPPLDAIQYENFETDHLLCWGQFSIDEDSSYGIPKHNLCLAGYPKNIELQTLKNDNQYHKCMILLARDSFRKTNDALLKILSTLSSHYTFCLKLHPSCDYNYYSNFASLHQMSIVPKEETINECLSKEDYDFCIAVNTTAYYESLMRGLPCLRFWDRSFDLTAGCNFDVFSTEKDFSDCIALLRNKSLVEYQTDIDAVLKYAMGVGVDNYRKIICDY